MSACAAQNLDRETQRINATYTALRSKLDAKQSQQLKDVQLAWIKFKDLACAFETASVSGASLAPLIRSNCLLKITRQRADALDRLNRCEEGDLSCGIR